MTFLTEPGRFLTRERGGVETKKDVRTCELAEKRDQASGEQRRGDVSEDERDVTKGKDDRPVAGSPSAEGKFVLVSCVMEMKRYGLSVGGVGSDLA